MKQECFFVILWEFPQFVAIHCSHKMAVNQAYAKSTEECLSQHYEN